MIIKKAIAIISREQCVISKGFSGLKISEFTQISEYFQFSMADLLRKSEFFFGKKVNLMKYGAKLEHFISTLRRMKKLQNSTILTKFHNVCVTL